MLTRATLRLGSVGLRGMRIPLLRSKAKLLCFVTFSPLDYAFLDPSFPEILARYNVKMHHLTPNAIIQLSKFYWVVRTFGALVSPDTFCRFYELHPQGWKIFFEGEDEIYSVQSGCCTFVLGRNNKVLKLDRV
jgi:hypothetical protein